MEKTCVMSSSEIRSEASIGAAVADAVAGAVSGAVAGVWGGVLVGTTPCAAAVGGAGIDAAKSPCIATDPCIGVDPCGGGGLGGAEEALGGGLGDPLFRAVGCGVGVVANGPTGRDE